MAKSRSPKPRGRGTPPTIFDEAIVSSVVDYGDSDRVVRLFCASHGRLAAFARGARRSKKRFGGGLMSLARGTVGLVRGRDEGLWDLTELDLRSDPLALAQDPETLGRASYLVELCERLLPEGEPQAPLFRELSRALELLPTATRPGLLLRGFELKLLGHTGYLPELDRVFDEPGEPSTHFDPVRGVLLASAADGAVPFDEEARAAALLLCAAELDAPPDVDDASARRAGRIFALHLRRMDIGPLRSVAYLKSLAAPLARS